MPDSFHCTALLSLPRWAVSHRQRLLELNSSLEFKLHRLHFIRLLAGGPEKQLEALSYARHFQPFARLHQRGKCPGGWGWGGGQGLGFSLFLDMLGGLSLYPQMVCYQKDGLPQLRNL